jgi:hypothetical protein
VIGIAATISVLAAQRFGEKLGVQDSVGHPYSVTQPSRLRVLAASRRDHSPAPDTGTVPELAAETAALRALNRYALEAVRFRPSPQLYNRESLRCVKTRQGGR